MRDIRAAPELIVERWFNTDAPLSVEALRGRVVLLYAFQMRCPACVEHSMPQAKRIHAALGSEPLRVIGLHTVFEDHAAMMPAALQSFIEENDLRFPIGVDAASEASRIPRTMRLYDMQGTPTLVAIDGQGHRRYQHLGHLSDGQIAALASALIDELR